MKLPKLTQEQIDAIFELQYSMQKDNRHLRAGQAFFNAIYQLHPNLADTIRGTELDPFHQDKKINILISKLT